MVGPDEVLSYWLDEVGPEGWYAGGADLDAEITRRFSGLWERVMGGKESQWLTSPSGCLAYIIVTDQFSRNMFRGAAKAFSSDHLAREAARAALAHGWDMKIDPPARQFFYMPFEHSEFISDQDHAVRLMTCRMPESKQSLLHACAHREIIRRFGRFPFRNEALGRQSSAAEQSFLAEGGYGQIVRTLQAASDAKTASNAASNAGSASGSAAT